MRKSLCATLVFIMSATPILASADTNEVEQTSNFIEATEQISPRAQYGVITENNVHIRASYGLSGTILGQLHKGELLDISYDSPQYADGYMWQKVGARVNGRYTWGWVATTYIQYY